MPAQTHAAYLKYRKSEKEILMMQTEKEKQLGILVAMDLEAKGLCAALTDAREVTVGKLRFYTGNLDGCPAVIAVSGIGKVNAAMTAEAMILTFGVTALLNTGVAGGLAEGLSVGDVVVADSVVQHDFDTTALGDPAGEIPGLGLVHIPADPQLFSLLLAAAEEEGAAPRAGCIASGDLFVADAKHKAAIRQEFDAVACEMEGGALGQVAALNGVPFALMRAVSDGGDGMEYAQFAPMAANMSCRVARAFARLYANHVKKEP